jgi:hypothetical protein
MTTLCELNRNVWDKNIVLQNITSSVFCIFASVLYITYMIITRLLYIVLKYAESNTYTFRSRVIRYSNVSIDYDYEDTFEEYIINEEEETNDNTESNDTFENKKEQIRSPYTESYMLNPLNKKKPEVLPRSVIISSMYLGGSGAFLSIIPLCMWDFSITASFINSMIVISMVDAQKKFSEFRPDTDKAQAIKNLKYLRLAYHLLSLGGTIIIGYNDIEKIPNNTNRSNIREKIEILMLKWPFLFLATCSPILLRAGGGGVGNFIYSISPSHTLEIGLPISVLLSTLVLCWYSPLQSVYETTKFSMNTVIPMFIVCPLCISGALTFILYGLKRRSCGVISCILLMVLAIREQLHHEHRFETLSDVISLCIPLLAFIVMIIYLSLKFRYMNELWSHKTTKMFENKGKEHVQHLNTVILQSDVHNSQSQDSEVLEMAEV